MMTWFLPPFSPSLDCKHKWPMLESDAERKQSLRRKLMRE